MLALVHVTIYQTQPDETEIYYNTHHGSDRGARQGRDGGTEEDGNGRELHGDKTDVAAMWLDDVVDDTKLKL